MISVQSESTIDQCTFAIIFSIVYNLTAAILNGLDINYICALNEAGYWMDVANPRRELCLEWKWGEMFVRKDQYT